MTQDCFCFLHTITQHALTARVNKDQLVDAHGRWFIDVYKSVLYLCRRTVVRVLFDISSNLCKFLFAYSYCFCTNVYLLMLSVL